MKLKPIATIMLGYAINVASTQTTFASEDFSAPPAKSYSISKHMHQDYGAHWLTPRLLTLSPDVSANP